MHSLQPSETLVEYVRYQPVDFGAAIYGEAQYEAILLRHNDCGFESEFAPHLPDSIGKPLHVLMVHDCPSSEVAD
jgi:hypothetical protein